MTTPFATLVDSPPWELVAFVSALLFYHVAEFAIAARYNRDSLSRHSWLLGKPYVVAMTTACAEYILECAMFPGWKLGDGEVAAWTKRVGLVMVIAGDLTRKAAEITARHNFTHAIQTTRRPTHTVVTRGVYRYARHPGYLGWLVWSIGTQVLLRNPACVVGFARAGWLFFATRIPYEEAKLRAMFPGEYAAHAARTRTWIPGIP